MNFIALDVDKVQEQGCDHPNSETFMHRQGSLVVVLPKTY